MVKEQINFKISSELRQRLLDFTKELHARNWRLVTSCKIEESEDRRARSKAIGSGPIPAGVRRFESGSSHVFFAS